MNQTKWQKFLPSDRTRNGSFDEINYNRIIPASEILEYFLCFPQTILL